MNYGLNMILAGDALHMKGGTYLAGYPDTSQDQNDNAGTA